MKKTIITITSILAMAAIQPAMAGESGHGQMHGDHHQSSMQEHGDMKGMQGHENMQSDSKQKKDMFLVKKDIDGYTVSFHAMEVAADMQHGGSHNVMIKIEKDGQALTGLTANSKVTHPNGKAESKMLMKMGDWYMAGYDLNHEGQHQIMVLFKTADNTKHFGGVYFPNQTAEANTQQHQGGMQHEH